MLSKLKLWLKAFVINTVFHYNTIFIHNRYNIVIVSDFLIYNTFLDYKHPHLITWIPELLLQ